MIVDLPELREKLGVFKDRQDAGFRLAKMLEACNDSDAIVLAVPVGGVPVAAVVAEDLNLVLDVAVVSKITLPWNTEAGFGAVAFDGTVRLNKRLLAGLGLTEEEIEQRIKVTTSKVQRRLREFRGDRPMPELAEREVILVDDGIASGFTLRVAVEALKNKSANEIIIAVPTGHQESLKCLVDEVKAVYCANVRSGWSFAVADAYKRWSDVDQTEALEILKRFNLDNT
ncbi:MAG: phosphoribosyltransferase [Planctomycetota bacterium]|jgi:predicted phosphoribosyltransferase